MVNPLTNLFSRAVENSIIALLYGIEITIREASTAWILNNSFARQMLGLVYG